MNFIWIDKDFQISTWWADFKTRNTIYIYTNNIPSQCIGDWKNSIRCLASLKQQMWVYNGLAYFSWTNIYK